MPPLASQRGEKWALDYWVLKVRYYKVDESLFQHRYLNFA
jgi:hypothetical protein